jgi:hypothetical protein
MALTVADIREYAKDEAPINILLDNKEQSSDPVIERAMRLTVFTYNAIQPISFNTLEDFPNDHIFLMGVLYHLCNTEAERQLRNQATYNAQGLNAGIDDKTQQYQQLAANYLQQFTSMSQMYKQSVNVAEAWGGVRSPYSALFTWRFRSEQ